MCGRGLARSLRHSMALGLLVCSSLLGCATSQRQTDGGGTDAGDPRADGGRDAGVAARDAGSRDAGMDAGAPELDGGVDGGQLDAGPLLRVPFFLTGEVREVGRCDEPMRKPCEGSFMRGGADEPWSADFACEWECADCEAVTCLGDFEFDRAVGDELTFTGVGIAYCHESLIGACVVWDHTIFVDPDDFERHTGVRLP